MHELNEAQQRAVEWGFGDSGSPPGPLLITAGAGTGKTRILVHRVARAVCEGFDPGRMLLLTFTRRAAEEMTRRVRALVRGIQPEGSATDPGLSIEWSGTFHAIALRLLRIHARAIGLDPSFTVLDEGDARDLLDLKRSDLGLDSATRAFPKKDTCLAIYSACVNRSLSLEDVLTRWVPHYLQFIDDLRHLFRAYVDAKRVSNVLDFDDLLLFWKLLLEHSTVADAVRDRFDLVFVDEFQDTNPLQGDILRLLKPDGRGVTVVGDEAQSIYAFRGTTIQNMLDFPGQYEPPAEVLPLEQNYRSVQPILHVANDVLAEATEGFRKTLTAHRDGGTLPRLISVDSLTDEAAYVVEQILANREAGWALSNQAVLVRVGNDTYQLETELVRRQIPYIKYGGQKLLEAAHIRDVLAVLRWVENPQTRAAGDRHLPELR
jgi:DNA helicase-2/ATP-dependent DNA helicase PcrA